MLNNYDFWFNILSFVVPCWIINISLNFLYPLEIIYPHLRKYYLPLDLSKRFFDGKRILGDSTTFLGIGMALLTGGLAGVASGNLRIGLLQGLAVYFGHALGSFIKRRLGVASGRYLPIVDHGDYVIFTGLVFIWFRLEATSVILVAIVITLALHPLASFLGFKMGIKKTPL